MGRNSCYSPVKMKHITNSLLVAGLFSALLACSPAAKQGEEGGKPAANEIKLTEVTNLTPGFISSVEAPAVGTVYEAGETVTVKLLPGEILSSGFASYHMEHIHIHVGDAVYMPEYPVAGGDYVQELEVKFPAPSESFGVVVAYAIQQKLKEDGYTMYLESADEGVQLFGVDPDKKYMYFDCYLRTPDAYTVNKVEFKMGDGQWEDLTAYAGCGFERTEALDWVYNVSVRPDYKDVTGDVYLRVSGTQQARYKISWKNTEFVRTDIPSEWQQNYFPEESISGETVTASFYTVETHYLDGATASVPGVEVKTRARSYVSFTMPESDIEISLDFKKKIPVSYIGGENITSAAIYDAEDIYYGVPTALGIPGESVYLFVRSADGYKPSKSFVGSDSFGFKLYGSGIDVYSYYSEVRIPKDAQKADISAKAEKAYYVSEAVSQTILFDNGSLAFPGETVYFTVFIPEGKHIESVSAKTVSGASVAVTRTPDSPRASLVMPSENVSVSVTYADNDSGSTVHVSAIYDPDLYNVSSSTNYDWDFESGFDVPLNQHIYLSVYGYEGEPFSVTIKIGQDEQTYQATMDPDFGEYEFGRSIVASADVLITVKGSDNLGN